MADPHQRADAQMPLGLHDNALGRIDQQDRQLGKRSPHRHIPRVFLVSRRVRHNKAALFGRKITVGNIDRDALLTLRHQSVQKQRIVNIPVRRSDHRIEL